ncbi:MAG TPA: redoxin domain-containing protein [Thermoleophilaceae bacterium]|nr:redoxin domain-containing protein [Thermoleophilaceae bacterium]
MIEAGEPAPDFSLSDQDGDTVSLKDLEGQYSVLVFFPAAFSPVCTDQLSVYEEVLPDLRARDAVLYGVSVDGAFALKAFRESLGTTIPLLSDFHPKGEVAKAYGVWVPDRGVATRALVMIGPDLRVVWTHQPPSPLEIPGANLIFDALDGVAA